MPLTPGDFPGASEDAHRCPGSQPTIQCTGQVCLTLTLCESEPSPQQGWRATRAAGWGHGVGSWALGSWQAAGGGTTCEQRLQAPGTCSIRLHSQNTNSKIKSFQDGNHWTRSPKHQAPFWTSGPAWSHLSQVCETDPFCHLSLIISVQPPIGMIYLQMCQEPLGWTASIMFWKGARLMVVFLLAAWKTLIFLFLIFVYLASLGLRCGMQDLRSVLWHVGSSSLTQDGTRAPWTGSAEC